MKVHFNLSAPIDLRQRYALTWAIPTLALSLAVLAWLVVVAIHSQHRDHQVQQSFKHVQSQENSIRSKEVHLEQQINRPEYQDMIRKTRFINQLINERQFSLTQLTYKVSNLLPPSARLSGLALASSSIRHPEVQFAVMGKDEESIETFLNHLEDSADFNNVIIKSQGFHDTNGSGSKQVALICTANYVADTLSSGN